MSAAKRSLTPSEAAKRLGVSTKTLRFYEQRGLIVPTRSLAGWRHYRPEDIEAAARIIAWRNLGLSLAEIERIMREGDSTLDAILATHENSLASRICDLQETAESVRRLRNERGGEAARRAADPADLLPRSVSYVAHLELPWPWGGETFDVETPRALNFIIGPLASGKTRLAERLCDVLPDAGFLGLDRLDDGAHAARAVLQQDHKLKTRVDVALAQLANDGAEISDALITVVAHLEVDTPAILVIDLIEQDLSAVTQEALGAYLRRRRRVNRPLFIMTRSTSILDLNCVDPDTGIILCPPNHSPPMYVAPIEGSSGYEAMQLCLATPEVRLRSEGVIAVHDRSAVA